MNECGSFAHAQARPAGGQLSVRAGRPAKAEKGRCPAIAAANGVLFEPIFDVHARTQAILRVRVSAIARALVLLQVRWEQGLSNPPEGQAQRLAWGRTAH